MAEGRTTVPAPDVSFEHKCVNTIRCLAMDGVQAANSGHPGTPMAMAPVAYCLWNRHLAYDPEDPIWPNRDRFVLSMGHASMLEYSMLHLSGVKAVNADYEVVGELSVKLDDLKSFRQLDSKCPGHPEYRWTSGVETTTGPLGQGYATSVGMAISSKWLGSTYNKDGMCMFDYNVYALGGDGCMMEGAASEAASLAGHLRLDNLCWIYDNNKITIEGNTEIAFTEDVATRFIAYGWNVTRVGDANDLDMLDRAFNTFKRCNDRPTLIIVDSHIAYGAPHKQDTEAAHGAPLGDEEIRLTKRNYGWPEDAKFLVPDDVLEHFRNNIAARGAAANAAWKEVYGRYKAAYPVEGEGIHQMQERHLPDGWDKDIPVFPANPKGEAGRNAGGKVLNAVAKNVPWLIGGSADLAPSTKTRLTFEGAGDFQPGAFCGRNFHFGVREFAMGSVMNGMSLSKVRPYGSGFMVFSDFSRPAIRLAALMEIPVIYIFTHDSIGVGEDGPTHQPIEHLAALRAIPGLITFRPGDANEVAEMWRYIMPLRHEPVVVVLSRQEMPTLDRTKYAPASGTAKGGYIVADADDNKPQVILMATGTEVGLMMDAYEALKGEGIKARAVSMPSHEVFEHQGQEYKDTVLPPAVKARVCIEQASPYGWHHYIGHEGGSVCMTSFGASAPLKHLLTKFGFTVENVVKVAKQQIAHHPPAPQ